MSNRAWFVVGTAAVAALLWGCDRSGAGASSENEGSGETAEAEGAAKAGPGARPVRGHGEEEHPDHGDGEEREERPADPPLTTPQSLGAEAPEGVEVVDATALMANPEQYRGKNISVSGTVKGYCHHGRAWYAIDVPGASPPYLRILARPTFSVPAGVIGSTAVTHGTVEVGQFPRARVQHFEGEHALGTVEGEDQGETVSRTVMRAAGAVFTPAAPAGEAPASDGGAPAPTPTD